MDTKAENIELINKKNKSQGGFNFNYMKNKKVFLIIACVLFAVGMILFIVRGFNWDIDFVGGTVMQYNLGKTLDASDQQNVERIVAEVTGQSRPIVQITEGTQITVKTLELDTVTRDAVFAAVSEEYNLSKDDIFKADSINPTVGKDLAWATIISVLVAVALMLVYITIRFDFLSGAAAVACLVHDMFVMLIFYSLLQIPMNAAVIAAFLTILGYSINATIIIFDRVRENMKSMQGSGTPFGDIVNRSINQTMLRSINTTITTLLTITMVYILGVTSIREFVLPLMVGILSGLYSSVCLSGCLWDTFKNISKKMKDAKTGAKT